MAKFDQESDAESSKAAIETLRDYFHQGRPIVPFLGAGVSAGSGFPLTETLREYLCKTKFFIRHSVYRRMMGRGIPADDSLQPTDFEYCTADYLLEYGWPDFNRLTADLWRYAEHPFPREAGSAIWQEWWAKLRWNEAAFHPNSDRRKQEPTPAEDWFLRQVMYLDRCSESLKDSLQLDGSEGKPTLETDVKSLERLKQFRDSCGWDINDTSRDDGFRRLGDARANLQAGYPVWAFGRNRLTSIVEFMLLELLKVEDQERAERIEQAIWNLELRVRVDWFSLLHDLVEGRRGLADELLAQLNRNRSPGLSHLMLTHLAKRLGWRLLLTLNHDSLLEMAFHTEGIIPKVFDVGVSTGVPDHALLRREPLSLVKLHGSAYGLRLGESTNDELDDVTRNRLLQYIPEDAILLVLGFSGYERRMMSLIEAIATPQRRGSQSRRIVWMYWGKPELPVQRLRQRLAKNTGSDEGFSQYRLDDAGSFLKGLYQRITNTLPATNTPYAALPKRVRSDLRRPTHDRSTGAAQAGEQVARAPVGQSPSVPPQQTVHLFLREQIRKNIEPNPSGYDSKSREAGDADNWPHLVKHELMAKGTGDKAMAYFVQQRRGYDTIWVDLEDHHTVTGVVADMITQLRVFDPYLPPLVPMTGSTTEMGSTGAMRDEGIDRAVRYLHRALRRGRYIFAFDSLEGFGRPQTVHHGLVSLSPDTAKQLSKKLYVIFGEQADKGTVEERLDMILSDSLKDEQRKHVQHIKAIKDLCENEKSRLLGYLRLRRLLLFFERLLSLGDITPDPERLESQSPRLIDWYFCLSADLPQPRHWDDQKRKGTQPSLVGSWQLVRDATERFLRKITQGASSDGTESGSSLISHMAPEYTKVYSIVDSAEDIPPRTSQKQEVGKGEQPSISDVPTSGLRSVVLDVYADADPDKLVHPVMTSSLEDGIRSAILAGIRHHGGPKDDSTQQVVIEPRGGNPCTASSLTAFTFYVMCLFRRPRNRSSLVSLLANRLRGQLEHDSATSADERVIQAAEEEVDRHLESLHREGMIYRSEGELYWIPQHLHEAIYKVLSRPFRLTTLKQGAAKPVQAAENMLNADGLRLLWLGQTHSQIAREYYINIWQRSGDTHALFEYLYHRMASLRYLMIFRTLVEMMTEEQFHIVRMAWSKSGVASYCMRLLRLSADDAADRQADPGVEPRWPEKTPILARVDSLRQQYVLALINVLERERHTLLTSATGDTWLNWIKQMLSVDLPEIYGGETSKSPAKQYVHNRSRLRAASRSLQDDCGFTCEVFRKAWSRECVSVDAESGLSSWQVRRRLEIVLLDIQGQLYREMGEFEECIHARRHLLKLLGISISEAKSNRAATSPQPTEYDHVMAMVGNPKRLPVYKSAFMGPPVNSEIHDKMNRRRARNALRVLVESMFQAIPKYRTCVGSARAAVGMVESAIIDIAASVRHLQPTKAKQTGTDHLDAREARTTLESKLLTGFNDATKQWANTNPDPPSDESSQSGDRTGGQPKQQDEVTAAQVTIRAGLRVAALRCQFEELRLVADRLLDHRFRTAYPGCWNSKINSDAAGSEDIKKFHMNYKHIINNVNRAEQEVYGAPFVDHHDFILQLSRFVTLRASLKSLMDGESRVEALRLFEQAESGLISSNADHLFHRVIIHTQRSYALMLSAEEVSRKPPDAGRRAVARRALTEAKGELAHAERLLGAGRRSTRVWLRLYRAKAQLAIEEVLHLAMVVSEAPYEVRKVDRFASELQDAMLYGLEAVRGALDCSKYPRSNTQSTSNDQDVDSHLAAPRLLADITAEHKESAGTYTLYLLLFVACRVVIKGYVASCNEATCLDHMGGGRGQNRRQDDDHSEGFRSEADPDAHKRWMQRVQELLEFPAQWKALSESVGLERAAGFFDEGGPLVIRRRNSTRRSVSGSQQKTASDTKKTTSELPPMWVSWNALCDLVCDRVYDSGWHGAADEPTTLRQIAQDRMVRLMSAGLAEDFKQRRPKAAERQGLPWIVHQLFLQREDLQ